MTPAEREEYRRIAREEARAVAEERARPIEQKLARHSGKFLEVREEVSPAVARQISESKHETEDRHTGFEKHVLRALEQNARANEAIQELAVEALTIAKSTASAMQPRALVKLSDNQGNTSIQPASLVAAESSVRTERTTTAIEVSANRADKQSFAAERWAKLGPVITSIVVAVLLGIAQFIQHLLASP